MVCEEELGDFEAKTFMIVDTGELFCLSEFCDVQAMSFPCCFPPSKFCCHGHTLLGLLQDKTFVIYIKNL